MSEYNDFISKQEVGAMIADLHRETEDKIRLLRTHMREQVAALREEIDGATGSTDHEQQAGVLTLPKVVVDGLSLVQQHDLADLRREMEDKIEELQRDLDAVRESVVD